MLSPLDAAGAAHSQGTGLAPGTVLSAGDLGTSGSLFLLLLIAVLSPEQVINSPYQCIVHSHRSPGLLLSE